MLCAHRDHDVVVRTLQQYLPWEGEDASLFCCLERSDQALELLLEILIFEELPKCHPLCAFCICLAKPLDSSLEQLDVVLNSCCCLIPAHTPAHEDA
eukprot:CAMPEP_0183340458 /NCGR_PEP_ID=MMETSP0164_2-20130417/7007_1 /TAXON_ID=221442 /ORGANISM="Coccolithus pelagicus ssp braarudi, Strain PLY182g" /LENGTH=96 /DNA_ID=CAMNT_0025510603 /DNA_START=665 /DNA_END=952 /DNA_ORIENTATION=-